MDSFAISYPSIKETEIEVDIANPAFTHTTSFCSIVASFFKTDKKIEADSLIDFPPTILFAWILSNPNIFGLIISSPKFEIILKW